MIKVLIAYVVLCTTGAVAALIVFPMTPVWSALLFLLLIILFFNIGLGIWAIWAELKTRRIIEELE